MDSLNVGRILNAAPRYRETYTRQLKLFPLPQSGVGVCSGQSSKTDVSFALTFLQKLKKLKGYRMRMRKGLNRTMDGWIKTGFLEMGPYGRKTQYCSQRKRYRVTLFVFSFEHTVFLLASQLYLTHLWYFLCQG